MICAEFFRESQAGVLVPAGYSVVSCQGYALATPARSVSWGRVKAAYR